MSTMLSPFRSDLWLEVKKSLIMISRSALSTVPSWLMSAEKQSGGVGEGEAPAEAVGVGEGELELVGVVAVTKKGACV